MTHVWRWGNTKLGLNAALVGRKGQPCEVLARGRNGNCMIRFADGYWTIAPRWAVRRLP